MKKNIKICLLLVLTLSIFSIGVDIARAGSITPPSGTPSAQFYTLSKIYDFINTNTSATEGGHDFTFSDSLAGGGYTLTQIYDALAGLISADKVLSGTTYLGVAGTIADNGAFSLTASSTDQSVTAGYYSGGTLLGDSDLISANIKNGINIFGVAGNSNVVDTSSGNATASLIASSSIAWVDGSEITGTLLGNLFNGTRTDGGFPGGSQANGGVDDYNNNKISENDTYSGSWTQCTEENDWCGIDTDNDGINDYGADAKDDSTNLIWSFPCNGAGCDSFSDASPATYTWTASSSAIYSNSLSTVQGGIVDASVLCTGGDHGVSGWYLPHQKQLMQAYIDGSWGNNTGLEGVSRYYWSATTQSNITAYAWYVYLSLGITFIDTKLTGLSYVRCVRPGN